MARDPEGLKASDTQDTAERCAGEERIIGTQLEPRQDAEDEQDLAERGGVKRQANPNPRVRHLDGDGLQFKHQVQSVALPDRNQRHETMQGQDDGLAWKDQVGVVHLEGDGLQFKHQVQSVASSARKQQQRQPDGHQGVGPDFKDQVRPARPQAQEQQERQRQPGAVQEVNRVLAFQRASDDPEEVLTNAVLVSETEVPLAAAVPLENERSCRKILWGLLILVSIASVVGGVCGTGNCGSVPSLTTEEQAPPAPPTRDPVTSAAIASYINNITLSGREIVYPVFKGSATTEDLALQWLIEDDPLQLTPDTAVGQFRLGQRYALATLYFQSTVPWRISTGWLDQNECGWFGIRCTDVDLGDDVGRQNAVSWVELFFDDTRGNNLHGRLSEDISLLASTKVLSLRLNSISGTIPSSIGNLTNMEYFNVRSNNMTGGLPDSVGHWASSLKEFWVYENSFSGTLPEQIGRWTSLKNFDTTDNAFSGFLPEESIGNWTRLLHMSVGGNSFRGTLPNSIGNWTGLTTLLVYNNAFTGTIPESIRNLNALQTARFEGNEIFGTIPSKICSLSTLEEIIVDCPEVDCFCCKCSEDT